MAALVEQINILSITQEEPQGFINHDIINNLTILIQGKYTQFFDEVSKLSPDDQFGVYLFTALAGVLLTVSAISILVFFYNKWGRYLFRETLPKPEEELEGLCIEETDFDFLNERIQELETRVKKLEETQQEKGE